MSVQLVVEPMETTRARSRSPKLRSQLAETDEKSAHDRSLVDFLDGHSAQTVFNAPNQFSGYTYDDLICMPGHINFGVHEVGLESRFTKTINLRTPLVSSPMDTVTEAKMAIAMALEGGIGVIHTNLPAEEQAREVMKVKKFECGFIMGPVCISPTMNLSDVDQLGVKCGFTGFPVTQDGKMGSKLIGLVTKRDTDFVQDRGSVRVAEIMTPMSTLVYGEEGVELVAANKLLRDSKKRQASNRLKRQMSCRACGAQ